MVVGGSAENYECLQAHEVKDKSMREAGGDRMGASGGGLVVGGVSVWEVVCVQEGGVATDRTRCQTPVCVKTRRVRARPLFHTCQNNKLHLFCPLMAVM